MAVDWSEWYPSGTVALDWLPLDMFYICVMIAAELHYFGTKAYYYPRPPLCANSVPKILASGTPVAEWQTIGKVAVHW